MSNSNLYVIIIGGGPAGTATAITCTKNGLKVLIIEGKQFPRHHPGETLHPGIEPLLKTLGAIKQIKSAGFLRHEGNWVKWPSEAHFIPYGSDNLVLWMGYQSWRADFDAILL
ncbi:tryptophan 7-halogenase [Bacillus thuringiensis]|nr:FAD-dependent oxidoreductase [Bacillus cereus]EJS45449.1 hypothetical protein ICE_05631 [Bacillus cereus BAG1X1-2]MED3447664.1 tryptophan 7-halogenase [Bacillus thuringiensis]